MRLTAFVPTFRQDGLGLVGASHGDICSGIRGIFEDDEEKRGMIRHAKRTRCNARASERSRAAPPVNDDRRVTRPANRPRMIASWRN